MLLIKLLYFFLNSILGPNPSQAELDVLFGGSSHAPSHAPHSSIPSNNQGLLLPNNNDNNNLIDGELNGEHNQVTPNSSEETGENGKSDRLYNYI